MSTAPLVEYTQDPSANLDYAVDFTAWLPAGDTISTFTVIADSGISATKSNTLSTATIAVIWVSGGVVGLVYTVTVRVTTTIGRVDDRTFYMRINNT
jgi:hypothetical protein